MEKILGQLKKPRNRNQYINEAIKMYNKYHDHKWLKKQLAKESQLGREESMKILREFEAIDNFDFD